MLPDVDMHVFLQGIETDLLGYRTFISSTVSDNAKLHPQMLESIFSVLVRILISTTWYR